MDANQFLNELEKLKPASTFLTLHGYLNDAGEVADYSIAFHISYQSALERSITKLEAMTLTTELEKLAREELVASHRKSLLNMETVPMEERDDAYAHFIGENGKIIKGVKLHVATGTLHLYGLVVHKLVKLPGSYKKVNSKPLTIAKKKLSYLTPAGKFRQFKITANQVDRIVVQGLSLLPPPRNKMNGHQLIELLQKQNLDLDVHCYVETCGCNTDNPIEIVEEDDTVDYTRENGYTKRRVLLLRPKADS